MSSSAEGMAASVGSAGASERRLRILAWVVFALTIAGVVAWVALDLASGRGVAANLADLAFLAYPISGLLLATRRPHNPLGWLMLFAGLGFAIPGEPYAHYAIVARDGELPGGELALSIANPTWVPFIGLSGFMLMVFPDGHLPSPRWRWFAWTCGAGMAAIFLLILFVPGDIAGDYNFPVPVDNPLGVRALEPIAEPLLVLALFAPLTVAGGALGLIVRRRRTTDPILREQIRWVAWAAGVIAVAYVLAFFPQLFGWPARSESWENWLGTIAVATFMLIPITIGIAVLRYRLYDIDVVIRKTVVYAVLAVLILVVGLGLAWILGGVFASTFGAGRTDLIAGLIVGLLVWPLRRVATKIADRIVYGGRATPYEVLTEFGDRLAATYAADDVLERTARVLAEGIGAERARVWLIVGEELTPVATWQRDDAAPDRSDEHRAEVRHQGELLGALSVTMPANDPMGPAKERLVADLASQAGLLLRNVRLVEDLRASRRRLVTAQDEERRRLERNVHDGAQQQLVAVSVKLGLLKRLAGPVPPKAEDLLDELQGDSQAALEDLRDLARGIYPPLLADKGLPAALEAQARRSAVPVDLEPDGVGRYPQEVEAAVYFSVLEALQNVAKYAGATRAEVRLRQGDGSLEFAVTDDGRGFDPSATRYGTGLQGIADRLAALDGTLEVTSGPGAGTRVRGSVPIQAPGR